MGLFKRAEDPRPILYVVEPLNYLLTKWQKARVVGNESKTNELLGLFSAGATEPTSLLSEFLPTKTKPTPAELLESTPLPLLGERRLLAVGGKKISIVVGLPTETKILVEDGWGEAAGQGGMLPLIVGSRYVHSQPGGQEAKLHAYAGTVLYEPVKVPWSLPTGERVAFISLLPPLLLEHCFTETFPEQKAETTTAHDVLTAGPLQAEWLLSRHNIVASASLRDRYQLLNLLDKHYRCRLISQNPADNQLRSTIEPL